jgi:hypothetical protein
MVQLELGEEIETGITDAARAQGISLNEFVRSRLAPHLLPSRRTSTLEERQAAVKELRTFARDRGIDLAPGVTIKSLLEEVRR